MAIAGITGGCRCECIKRKSSQYGWKLVCDGADKVTKLIKQKEKPSHGYTKRHEKIKLVTKLSKHSDYTVIWTSTPIYNFVK